LAQTAAKVGIPPLVSIDMNGPQPTFVGRPPNGSYEPKFYIAAKGLLSLLSISPRQNTSIRANRLGRKTMYTFGVT
jgi:hypothetical protein